MMVALYIRAYLWHTICVSPMRILRARVKGGRVFIKTPCTVHEAKGCFALSAMCLAGWSYKRCTGL